MESHYEKQPAPRTHYNKGYVDFYRSGNVQQDQQQVEGKAIQQEREHYEGEVDFEVEAVQLKGGNRIKQTASSQANYLSQGSEQSQPSQNPSQKQVQNPRRMSEEKSGGTRQSVDSKEKSNQQKQVELNNPRTVGGGARSVLNSYDPKSAQLVTNLRGRHERELSNEQFSASSASNQPKSGLQKVQQQNRIMFTSPESLQGNNKYQESLTSKAINNQQDKISFFKDSQQDQNSDLLFKQHLQNSSAAGKKNGTYQVKPNKQHLLSNCSTKECTFCKVHCQTAGNCQHTQTKVQCSAIFCQSQNQIGLMMQGNLSKKYSTNRDYYNVKIVNDLIYNENTHIVSIFKDYLILDDINEFLKRSYTTSETKVRLPKLCSFYDKYSQVFPNYVVLPESKYMFKNIQRKQKLIDELYQIQEEQAKRQGQEMLDEDKMFNSKFYNSIYKQGDISMSRQQYEDQAKQIAQQVGKKPTKVYGRIEEMKIEDLVDRFLIKDSESNIQLMTTAGIDFSLHQSSIHGSSQIMGQSLPEKTPYKTDQKPVGQPKVTQYTQQQPQISQTSQKSKTSGINKRTSQQDVNPKRQSGANLQPVVQPLPSTTNQGKQKVSFQGQNNYQSSGSATNKKGSQPKLDPAKTNPPVTQQQVNNGSSKNTPRMKKGSNYASQETQSIQQQQQQIQIQTQLQQQQSLIQQQTSPATKEALNTYLNHCQIDLASEGQSSVNVQVLESSGKYITTFESPNIKSPTTHSFKNLMASGSQSSLLQQQQQQHMQSLTNTIALNRQNVKSTCALPITSLGQNNHIQSMKKTTNIHRMSNGGNPSQQVNSKSIKQKASSPVPQVIFQQQITNQTRNQQQQNMSQKNNKNVNTHAKYLSGGNEQYQRLLNPNQAAINHQQQIVQNTYATQETLNSLGNSSQKKAQIQSKLLNSGSNLQNQDVMYDDYQQQQQQYLSSNGIPETEIFTGEDCDDVIADERFASPDIYVTDDNNRGNVPHNFRRSVEGRSQGYPSQILLTSSDDKMLLSQYNNYDQIKKHLERYITTNNQPQQSDINNTSSPGGKKVHYQKLSESKQRDLEHKRSASNRNTNGQLVISSGTGSIQNETNNSRNASSVQKQFESLKNRIRGVFEKNDVLQQASSTTPLKNQLISTKSQQANNMNTRMSLESKEMMLNPNSLQGCLSSTSAAGRTLSFYPQNTFQNQQNYRSVTNLQQRNASALKESMNESQKRVSQNRQSFKEVSNHEKIIKRCATGKTLSINDIQHHTFGSGSGILSNSGIQQMPQQPMFLNSVPSASTLLNPTFISNSSSGISNVKMQQAKQLYSNSTVQQTNQQAANTVRVMTPSYSLASLSKMVTPTTSTSPLTMTVNLTGQGRKQLPQQQTVHYTKKSNNNVQQQMSNTGNVQGIIGQNTHQRNPSNSSNANNQYVNSGSGQTFLLADKNNKIVKSQTSQNTLFNKTNRITQKQVNLQSSTTQKKPTLIQSNSAAQFQQTPRTGQQFQQFVDPTQKRLNPGEQQSQHIQESSQNMSCTVSTENNSAKTLESKHPKFMRTIEEIVQPSQHSYNSNILSQSHGAQYATKSLTGSNNTGLTSSTSLANLDIKIKSKIQQAALANQPSSNKRLTGMLAQSSSVQHFKSPSQQITSKKQHI